MSRLEPHEERLRVAQLIESTDAEGPGRRFATRARQLRLPDSRLVILTDTVGFIREMPKGLFVSCAP